MNKDQIPAKKLELIAIMEEAIASPFPCIPLMFADKSLVFGIGTSAPGIFPIEWLCEINDITAAIHGQATWELRLFINLFLLEMLESEEEGTDYHANS